MQPQFPNKETERFWSSRAVLVDDLTSGRVDISAVPFRYVTVYQRAFSGGQGAVLSVVEWLEQFDWELVNVYYHDSLGFGALIRRKQPLPQPERLQDTV